MICTYMICIYMTCTSMIHLDHPLDSTASLRVKPLQRGLTRGAVRRHAAPLRGEAAEDGGARGGRGGLAGAGGRDVALKEGGKGIEKALKSM